MYTYILIFHSVSAVILEFLLSEGDEGYDKEEKMLDHEFIRLNILPKGPWLRHAKLDALKMK